MKISNFLPKWEKHILRWNNGIDFSYFVFFNVGKISLHFLVACEARLILRLTCLKMNRKMDLLYCLLRLIAEEYRITKNHPLIYSRFSFTDDLGAKSTRGRTMWHGCHNRLPYGGASKVSYDANYLRRNDVFIYPHDLSFPT